MTSWQQWAQESPSLSITCFQHMTTDKPSAERTINDDTNGGLLVWRWVEKLPPAATETWRQVPVRACPLSDNPGYKQKQKHPFLLVWHPVQNRSLTRAMTCFALDAFNYLLFFIIFFKPWGPWGHTWNRPPFLQWLLNLRQCLKGGAVNCTSGCKIWEKCTTNQKTVGGDMDLKVAGASPKWWSRIKRGFTSPSFITVVSLVTTWS